MAPWKLLGGFWAAPGRLGAPRQSFWSTETKFFDALNDPGARQEARNPQQMRHPPHENLFIFESIHFYFFDSLNDPGARQEPRNPQMSGGGFGGVYLR